MKLQDFDPNRSWLTPTYNNPTDDYSAIWYIGTENTIREGLDLLFDNLDKNGHILLEEPIIFDYLHQRDDLIYVVLYKSLPKLEYLEYQYEKTL